MRNPLTAALSTVVAEAPLPVGLPTGSRPRSLSSVMAALGRNHGGLEQVATNGLLFQIAAVRARRLASAKFELVRVDDADNSANVDLSDNDLYDRPHIADQVWRKPNPFFTGTAFLQLWSMHWDLLGERHIAPTMKRVGAIGPTIPTELWLLDPRGMTPIPHPTKYLVGWHYRPPTGIEMPVGLDEVWSGLFPNPADPYRGVAALSGAGVDLAAGKSAAEAQEALLENDGQPGMVIETLEKLTDSEFKRLQKELRESHSGPRKRGVPLLVEKGKLNFTGWSPKEMEFSTGREQLDHSVRQAFGVSKTILGIGEDVNRATADVARALEAENHTLPKLVEVQEFLNGEFLPAFAALRGPVAYRFVDPRPTRVDEEVSDRDSRVGMFQALVAAGADPADAVVVAGLPEVPFEAPSPAPPPPQLPPAAPDIDDDGDEVDGGPGAALLARVTAEEVPPELQVIQDDWDAALAAVMAAYAGVKTAWLVWALDQIRSRLASGRPLGTLQLPSGEVVAMVDVAATAELGMAETAAGRVVEEIRGEVDEADRAGVVPVAAVDNDSIAVDTAWLLAGAFIGSIVSETIRLNEPGSKPDEVVSAVRQFVIRLADAGPKDRFKALLTRAQNRARVATIELAAKSGLVVFEASESLDANSCGPCRGIHGTRFESAAEARRAYPASGFKDCDGGARCRGTIVPRRR